MEDGVCLMESESRITFKESVLTHGRDSGQHEINIFLTPSLLIPLSFTRVNYEFHSRSLKSFFYLSFKYTHKNKKKCNNHSQTTINENKTSNDTIRELVNEMGDRLNQRVHTYL